MVQKNSQIEITATKSLYYLTVEMLVLNKAQSVHKETKKIKHIYLRLICS
jgi:hypothetical protein